MRRCLLVFAVLCAGPISCGSSVGSKAPPRTPVAAQWFERARVSYRGADFDDARDATRHALAVAPSDPEIRELAARIALARLEFPEALGSPRA